NGPELDRGQYVQMVNGPNDSLYVAYYDARDTDIRRAKLTDGNWVEMDGLVDGDTADVGTWLSLAVGANGGWHMAYRDDTAASLRIISVDAVNNGCHGENGPGTPLRITYQDMADAGLPSADFGTHTSTGILSDGRLAVSFYDAWRTNLMLVTCKEDSFQLQLLDGETVASDVDTDAGRWSSLAVDPSTGRLGVAYHDATLGALKYITSRDGTLSPIIVDDGGNAGHHVGLSARLAFEARPGFSESLPRIAYVDSTGRKILFARRSIYGEWEHHTVTTLPPLGERLDGFGPALGLTIDTQDRAYITYSRWMDENTELNVAVCDGPLCAEGPE
ncbi:MAG: hypothetical protein VX223_15320, partial [Myxococcota bacterium]|nr:hypothetical protein [Myxococcota bacterium]